MFLFRDTAADRGDWINLFLFRDTAADRGDWINPSKEKSKKKDSG